jgi:hypothetical protein
MTVISRYLSRLHPRTIDTKNKIVNGVTGSDTKGNGTTNPYKTIMQAVSVAQFPADIQLFESFTENIQLVNSRSNINFIGSRIYNHFKVEINGNFQTSSADANNRFTRLGVTGVNIKSGSSSPVVLGSFDAGRHTFENVAFTTSNSNIISIPTNFLSGSWINFIDCDFSGSPASTLVFPDLDGSNTGIGRIYNCGFTPVSVGRGWTIYYSGDTVLNVVSKHSSAIIVDFPRCYRMTSIITSQASLNTLVAITNNSANGVYLINFPNPTGITGIASGDVILKNGSVHMITMKYADAPASVIDYTTNISYIKDGSLWRDITSLSPLSLPAFRAIQGSNLSLSSGVTTKINFSTIDWQVGSYYNTSLYRYTPPAGYYCVSVGGYLTGSVPYDAFLGIYKNGSQYAQTLSAGNNGGSAAQLCLTDLIYLNGTDYIEAYATISLASAGTCSVLVSNGFSAFQIR